MRWIALAVVVTGIAVGLGGGGGVLSEGDGAAEEYAEAARMLDSLSAEEWEVLRGFVRDPEPSRLGRVSELLGGSEGALRLMASATSAADAGFLPGGSFVDPNPPQVIHLARLETVVAAEAYASMMRGESGRAARAVSSLYRMGEHLSETRSMMALNRSRGLVMQAERACDWGLETGAFGRGEAGALLEGLETYATKDPLHFTETLRHTNATVQTWYRQSVEEGRADKLEKYLQVFDPEARLAGMDRAFFDEALGFVDRAFSAAVEVSRMEDPERAKGLMHELVETYGEHELGFLVPWMEQVASAHDGVRHAEGAIVARRAQLRAVRDGRIGANELLNAAHVYRRAFALLRESPAEVRDRLRSSSPPENGEYREWRGRVKHRDAILEVVEEAASIETCRFYEKSPNDVLLRTYARRPVPEELPEMHALLGLVMHEATLARRERRREACVGLVETALGMIGHLGKNPSILNSLVADRHARRAGALIERLAGEGDGLSEKAKETLMAMLDRMPASDPLGYRRATGVVKEAVARGLAVPTEARPERAATEAREAVQALNADQAMSLLVYLDCLRARRRATAQAMDGAAEEVLKVDDPAEGRLRSIRASISVLKLPELEGALQSWEQVDLDEVEGTLRRGAVDELVPEALGDGGVLRDRARAATGVIAEMRAVLVRGGG